MNKKDITTCLENPTHVDNIAAHDIRELLAMYPYCEALHYIYLRKLFIDDDARFEGQLSESVMHISNRRTLFNYLNHSDEEVKSPELIELGLASIDYFSMDEKPNQQKSLQELAKKLKEARLARSQEQANAAKLPKEVKEKKQEAVKVESPTEDYFSELSSDFSSTLSDLSSLAHSINGSEKTETTNIPLDESIVEQKAKELIKEKKYSEALEILKAINLNNPKKSIYFANQIKYLETIIENNK